MRTCSHDKPQGWCQQFLHWHCKQRHEGRFFGGRLSDLSASRVWSGTRRLCDVLFWRHTSMAMVPWSLVTGRWLLPNKVNKESQVTWNGSDVEGITTVWWFGRKESIFFYWLYRKPFPLAVSFARELLLWGIAGQWRMHKYRVSKRCTQEIW